MKHKYNSFENYLTARVKEKRGPFLATDIIIEYSNNGKKGIVLIERKNYPYGLALPGGMAENNLTLHENAIKEAREETGLEVKLYEPLDSPFCVMSELDQDPRARIVSVTYIGKGCGELKPHPKEDAKDAKVCDRDEIIELLRKDSVWAMPHHRKIVEKYINERWKR